MSPTRVAPLTQRRKREERVGHSGIPGLDCVRKIVVSSNCQTGGLAAALQAIFPQDSIKPVPFPPATAQDMRMHWSAALADVDVWVTTGGSSTSTIDLPVTHRIAENHPRLLTVSVPIIRFDAFHPDICLVRKLSTNELTCYYPNSTIGAWAYKNRIEITDAAKLFEKDVFHALGYFDAWIRSVSLIRKLFQGTTLEKDFDRFFLRVKRGGVFMHMTNHPKIQTLIHLGKIVSTHIGRDESVFKEEIHLEDGLASDIWPVYPAIAEEFSLAHSGFQWKVKGKYLHGIPAYLNFAYNSYQKQGIVPPDMKLANRDDALLDRVLGARLGASR